MAYTFILTCLMFVSFGFSGCVSSHGMLVITPQTTLDVELRGFNGLAESSLYKGTLAAGNRHEINIPYRGLALLVFPGGQTYPVIIEDGSFDVAIAGPAEPPTFTGSAENDLLYKSLSGNYSVPEQYEFVNLMIQAKDLLESSHSIKTVEELTAKKEEYHQLVRKHYESLSHSDMIKRLIAQYFMMHEYVNYHTEGAPATDIRNNYQQAVIAGVGSWIEVLRPYLPEQEILNYCVSLYYNRSMVTLASEIVDNFRNIAYCPGDEKETFVFPDDLRITDASNNKDRILADFKGAKIVAFVSVDCPVSMVKTVVKARDIAQQKEAVFLIVAPLEPLSNTHLSMFRMISGGSLFFVNDEGWRKNNLTKKIRLPLFLKGK